MYPQPSQLSASSERAFRKWPRAKLLPSQLLRPSALAAALALALAASACSPTTLTATQTEVPKQIKLTYSVLSWPVKFDPASSAMSPGQGQALSNFLSTARTGDGDQVTIDAVPGPYGEGSTLADQRQASVDLILRSLQMSPSTLEASQVQGGAAPSSEAPGDDVVVVNIGRYIVSGPSCPDWTKPQADDFSNTSPSNFGCATLTNLARMVANPADLLRGSTMGAADGDYAADGVAAYHAGTIDKGVSFVSDVGGIQ